jgi:hypothetical protein
MGQFLRHRRFGGWRADRIAVRRGDADCAKGDHTGAGSERRFWHADDRSLRRRIALIRAGPRAVASDHSAGHTLGCDRIMRRDLQSQCHPAHAQARRVRAGSRGLVISCRAAGGGLCNTGAIGNCSTPARVCLELAQRPCCCCSSASTMPGTRSFITYFSASAAQTMTAPECRQSCRALKRSDLG